jgi:hypothetical protein
MNVIQQWLARAEKEFSTPEEMREAAQKVADKNTRKLLENRASAWGAAILIKKHDKHWSAT